MDNEIVSLEVKIFLNSKTGGLDKLSMEKARESGKNTIIFRLRQLYVLIFTV